MGAVEDWEDHELRNEAMAVIQRALALRKQNIEMILLEDNKGSFSGHSLRSGKVLAACRALPSLCSPYPGSQPRKPLWIGAPYLWAYSPYPYALEDLVCHKKSHIRELRPTSQGEISRITAHPRAPDPLLSTTFSQALHFQAQSGKEAREAPLTAAAC